MLFSDKLFKECYGISGKSIIISIFLILFLGGHMFTMEGLIQYAKNYNSEFRYFPLIDQRKFFLRNAVALDSDYFKNAGWTTEVAKTVFKMLIESKFVLYEEIIEKFGELAISSLIEHNIVQFRPCPPIVVDIPGHKNIFSL